MSLWFVVPRGALLESFLYSALRIICPSKCGLNEPLVGTNLAFFVYIEPHIVEDRQFSMAELLLFKNDKKSDHPPRRSATDEYVAPTPRNFTVFVLRLAAPPPSHIVVAAPCPIGYLGNRQTK